MKLAKIKLNTETELPTRITVQMTIEEAAFITKVLGNMNHIEGNAIMTNGGTTSSGIYDCFTGCLFNKFWDDGIHGYNNNTYVL